MRVLQAAVMLRTATLVDLSAVHLDEIGLVHGVAELVGVRRAAAEDGQQVAVLAVGLHERRSDAHAVLALVRRDHGSAGTVAEQHAGGAVLPVGSQAEHFGGHHEHHRAGIDGGQGAGGVQGVDEPRAGRVEVEGHASGDAELVFDLGGGVGAVGVRRAGGADEVGHLRGVNARFGQGGPGGIGPQVRGHVPLGDVAVLDARAGGDPFVAGFHQRLEVRVGHDFGGERCSRTLEYMLNMSCVGGGGLAGRRSGGVPGLSRARGPCGFPGPFQCGRWPGFRRTGPPSSPRCIWPWGWRPRGRR